jgi:hypothetical protein
LRFSLQTAVTFIVAAFASLPRIAEAQTIYPPLPPAGQSVVGQGVVHPLLNIETSGGNDVFALRELVAPVAFGGGAQNFANYCLGPDGGFADLGNTTFHYTTKNHQYAFAFTSSISEFTIRMVDWGDFLPYGGNVDQTYAVTMTAYNAANDVVDTDTVQFTSSSTATSNRPSNEFGPLGTSGDACLATAGQPGNYTFHVQGSGIVRVTLSPRDRPSTDPNIAFSNLGFTIEALPVQIDVKPGDSINSLNRGSRGSIPVAILSSADFDAATVVPESIRIAGASVAVRPNGSLRYSMEDVNGDGFADLVFHVNTSDISGASTLLRLTAETSDGGSIVGEDTVVFVP